MKKNYLILVILLFIILIGVGFAVMLNNWNNNIETNKNGSKNNIGVVENNGVNYVGDEDIYKKVDSSTIYMGNNNMKTEKKVEISKKQVIRIIKDSYHGDYKINSINLVKNNTGNYFWIVKVNEITYGKSTLFINARTGEFVHPLRVGLDKFAENEVSQKEKNSNKRLNIKSDNILISKRKAIQTSNRIDSEINEEEKLENNVKLSNENKNIIE
ncbi:hypothetical protein [Methanobrevibacter sp.]|uniref:hypothetical protein n=1 Tax=Methanobrevibacter sp. TaxID=66852 RepID=UPI0026338EA2|nr:hypothetical protein [uncultured Methanobrevibacter sp.]